MGNTHTSFSTQVNNNVSVDTSQMVSSLTSSSTGVTTTSVQIQSITIGPQAIVYAGDISMLQTSNITFKIVSVDSSSVDTSAVTSMQNSVAQSAANAITKTAQDMGILLSNLGSSTTDVTNTINSSCAVAAQSTVTSQTIQSLMANAYDSKTQTLVINGQINVKSLTMDQNTQVNIAAQQMVYSTLSSAMSSSAMSDIVNKANNQSTQTFTGIAGIISSIGNAFAQPVFAGAMAAGIVLVLIIVLFKFVLNGKGGGGGGGKPMTMTPSSITNMMPGGGAALASGGVPGWGAPVTAGAFGAPGAAFVPSPSPLSMYAAAYGNEGVNDASQYAASGNEFGNGYAQQQQQQQQQQQMEAPEYDAPQGYEQSYMTPAQSAYDPSAFGAPPSGEYPYAGGGGGHAASMRRRMLNADLQTPRFPKLHGAGPTSTRSVRYSPAAM